MGKLCFVISNHGEVLFQGWKDFGEMRGKHLTW